MKARHIGLVSCTSKKLERAAPARALYSASPNFRKWVAWVERSCDHWFVLSARHHLVHPDQVLFPYDETLDGAAIGEKRRWSAQVVAELERVLDDLGRYSFEIHAGRNYWAFGLRGELEARGATVTIPAEGLGMFKRPAFYSQAPGHQAAPKGRREKGSYEPLREYLVGRDDQRVELSFDALERILGRKLPASAHNHRAWWGNHVGTHSHARSWLEAGWKVDQVNLTGALVAFRKES